MKQESRKINNSNGTNHFHHEILAWERALDFQLTENSYLKTSLALAVDTAQDKRFLENAERYQSIFLKNDEVLKRVLTEVKQQQERMKRTYLTTNPLSERNFEMKQSELRDEVEGLEKEFSNLKREFNNYLVSTL